MTGARAFDGAGPCMAALQLALLLAQSGVRPLVGASRPRHVDALAAALDMQLDRKDVEAIAGRMM